MTGEPRIGLALGGGAARGLAHITLLEAFDELGLKPAVIAGTSMGALVGAGYASGMSAREIAGHAEAVLSNRGELFRRLFQNRDANLFDFKLFGHMLVSGETLVSIVIPDGTADRIEHTKIPFKIVATDFYGRCETLIDSGPMRAAIAASIAIPGLISAQPVGSRVLIDGAISNPVPFDYVRDGTDLVVALDVTGGPVPRPGRRPANIELAFGATQILMRSISKLMRDRLNPDIYIEPDIDRFRVLDFFRVREILEAARPAKEELKRQLADRLTSA